MPPVRVLVVVGATDDRLAGGREDVVTLVVRHAQPRVLQGPTLSGRDSNVQSRQRKEKKRQQVYGRCMGDTWEIACMRSPSRWRQSWRAPWR